MGALRLFAIMGSGETAPTMTGVHRALVARLRTPVRAVLLDTPYGFQLNADDVTGRAVGHFARGVGLELFVATWRGVGDDQLVRERALARVRDADYVSAGPGSPTYALRVWGGDALRSALAAKPRDGGCVCFASAAALTLGVTTVPVYEVYKVGEPPHWVPGLDLLAELGLRAAVIPHFDNAEGGNHDTRYCYLGERRLRILESSLDADTFILGVDEHTACVFDLDAGTASIHGRGALTIRRAGLGTVIPAGATVSIDAMRTAGTKLMAPSASPLTTARSPTAPSPTAPLSPDGPPTAASPSAVPSTTPQPSLRATADELREAFFAALAAADVDAAVRAALKLEQSIVDWSADTEELDSADGPRADLRAMIVRLGDLAALGTRDPRELLAPLVDALVELRAQGRTPLGSR